MIESAKSPSPTRRIFGLLMALLLIASILPIIATIDGPAQAQAPELDIGLEADDPPTSNTFGNPYLPDWKDVIVDNSDPKWLVINNADGLVFKFATEKDKFNEIYQDNALIVKDERWLIYFDDKEGGSTAGLEWERVENYNVRVTQLHEDKKSGSGSSYKVIWDFYGGFRPKVTVELETVIAGEYKIDWRANLYKTYAENKINYVRFYENENDAVVFDYSDVYEGFGDITSLEGVDGWFKGKRFDLYFDIGSLGVENFRLDPNFGRETRGPSSTSFINKIGGSWFSCPESGTATSITVYIREYTGETPTIKCAIYKKSDDSLIGYTEEWALTSGWNDWKTFNIISGGTLEATDYYLVFWSSAKAWFYYGITTDKGAYQTLTYNSFPNPWDPTVSMWHLSIYCTYALPAPPPGKPILISPENDHSTSDNTPTFVWENGSDATSHRLVIDNSRDFDDGENIYDNASAWDNSGTTIENELPADNYWWKVAGVANSTENWSENTWTFEITIPPVGVPLIVVPRVFASVYTKGESGTVWAQVLDTNGDPVNAATVTLTVWEPDGDKYLDAVSMGFVTGSNGIYKYAITAPSEFGTFLCDVTATWNGSTAYGCGEFQVASWAENILSILDNLIAHRNAVEATISDIEAYVDTLESGQSTIIGHVDTLESGQSTITGYVDTIETVLGDPTAHGYTDIAHALGVIDNFVDQVEGYTDALESGQTTIQNYVDTLEDGQSTLMGYTDAVEGNQQLILDNIDLLKQGQSTIEGYTDTLESGQSTITGYVDQVEGYTDQVEGFVDDIEQYMGVAAMITDTETLYNYLKNTVVPYVDSVETYTDQIEGYVDTLESGQTTITGHVDTLEGGQATITDYVDTLETGQSAITAKLNWVGDYLENTIKPQLDTIEGYVDSLESWSENIKDNLDLIKTRLGDPSTYGYTNVFEAINTVEEYVDQVEGYTDTLETGQTTIQNFVDTLESGQTNIFDNFTLVLSNQSTIVGYVDQVEGYTDSLEGYCDEIEFYMGVAAMITDEENLYNYLKNTIVPYVDQVEGYTDQVEGYTDTLEGGQATITDYVDTLESGQTTITAQLNWIADYLENTMKPELDNILDNVQNNYTYLSGTIKPQLDQMRENIDKTLDNAVAVYTYLTGTVKPAIDDAYNQAVTNYDYLTDTIKPQLDNIQENLTATAELPENIMDNIFATYSFLTENVKPELDNVYENVNASYNYLINTINPKLDEIAAGVGVGLSIEVTRYYQLNVGDLQEFYVTIVKGTNVDWVTITLEDPKSTLVVDNASMSNPAVGSYYHSFSTSGREAGGWLATIVARDENLTTTYRGFWRLGGEGEAVGYLTLTLLDNETNEPIEGAKVELYKAGTLVESKYARWDGQAFLDIMNWGIHELKWSKDGYETETMEIDLAVSSDLTLKMVPTEKKAQVPPITWILAALIFGGVLVPLVYYGSGKKAKAGSLFISFILPVLLLCLLWFAGVVG